MKILYGFLLIFLITKLLSQTKVDSLENQIITLKNDEIRIYHKPKLKEIITRLPKDFMDTNRDFVTGKNPYYVGGAIAATALLVPFDQKINDNARIFAQNLGLSEANIYAKSAPIPKNLGAGFYLLGNGTTVILLSAGFYTFGLLKNDYRAQATAQGMLESLALSGVYVQTIKRITGRESPFIAKENGNPGGDWNPFPSFSAYQKSTPHYDAVPSGHLATIMSGFTVITQNYPDVKWLKPVGYTAIGLLCFQMVQSQVHWTSDYPIALIIGYFTGKNIAKNRYKVLNQSAENKKYKMEFVSGNFMGITTAGINVKF